jgi:hypothetical protein
MILIYKIYLRAVNWSLGRSVVRFGGSFGGSIRNKRKYSEIPFVTKIFGNTVYNKSNGINNESNESMNKDIRKWHLKRKNPFI